MSRVNLENNKAYELRIESWLQLASMNFVPADNAVIDPDSPPFIMLDPAGAVDVLLPESTEARKGLMFLIANISANAITFKSSGDAAFTTAIVLAANETTWIVCTGSATPALGWRAVGTASSA